MTEKHQLTDEDLYVLLEELTGLQALIVDLRRKISLSIEKPNDEVEEAFEDCAATYEEDEEPKLTRKGGEHGDTERS